MAQQTALMKREEYPVDVRRLAQDIKDLLPNGNKLQDFEALALASSARALKLNPFIGEIWYIPGHGLMSGIKGHRRTAHEQMHTTEGGGNYWPEFDVMTPEQKKQYLVPETALGFICRLYDSATLRTYSETVEKLFKAGAPWADIKHVIGDRPYTIGVGFYQSGEQTRMKPHQCAMKRAEADALKRRFDLPFEGGAGTANDGDTDNGNFTVETPEEVQSKRNAGGDALYGETDIDLGPELKDDYSASQNGGNGKAEHPATWPAQVITWAVQKWNLKPQQVVGALNKSTAVKPSDPDTVLQEWLTDYRTAREENDSDASARIADEKRSISIIASKSQA